MLAHALAGSAKRRVLPDALKRTRATPAQGQLARLNRIRNVAVAFAVAPRPRPKIAGTRILSVDDVIATGAAIRACSRALLATGAATVVVVTVARVVKGDPKVI
ncbi:MAG: hypothetical protein EXQ91_06345 [Alphaproteobacteria bacterium]|nr:hypothetical protein [Alphaproteobacteria bacterium]